MALFKLNPKHKILCFALYGIFAAFLFAGCQNDVYDPNQKGEAETPNSFDFATTSSIQLNVKYYVPQGYKVLFEVYLENPFITNEDGQIVKRTDIEPVIKRMTDGNGVYSSKETITADHGKEAFIYTSYVGVPGFFKTTLVDNIINADIKPGVSATTRQTRVATSVPNGFHTLGTWTTNGRPNFLDSEGQLELSAEMLNTINKTLPEGGTCPAKFRQSTDFVLNDPEERKAEVSVRFIGGKSGAASMFGYYCYKDGASIEEIQKAKKIVILPNTITSQYNKPIALQGGESVKLHYFDENGIDKGTVFPNGTKLGWFLLNDAFVKSGTGFGAFYSTIGLSSRTHTAAFRINNFVVLAFEDWNDNDYNDVLFNVWSNPIEAIAPDVPEVKPDEGDETDKSIAYHMTYKGIVSFEDQWPKKGDYDMNDVVVKYESKLSFNTKNEVLFTEDVFSALWSGASYKNGFAYQLETDRSNVTTEFTENPVTFTGQGLDSDISQATINVFLNARDLTGNNTKTVTYKLKNTFTTPIAHEGFGTAPYNSFIMVDNNLGNARKEIHLVGNKPTEKADKNLFHTEQDLSDLINGNYYVAAQNYPFAIHLIDAEEFSAVEGQPIDHSFPDFAKWVKSNGTENKDWYKKK